MAGIRGLQFSLSYIIKDTAEQRHKRAAYDFWSTVPGSRKCVIPKPAGFARILRGTRMIKSQLRSPALMISMPSPANFLDRL